MATYTEIIYYGLCILASMAVGAYLNPVRIAFLMVTLDTLYSGLLMACMDLIHIPFLAFRSHYLLQQSHVSGARTLFA